MRCGVSPPVVSLVDLLYCWAESHPEVKQFSVPECVFRSGIVASALAISTGGVVTHIVTPANSGWTFEATPVATT